MTCEVIVALVRGLDTGLLHSIFDSE